MANPFGKTRKVEEPYAVYAAGDWEWRVLKTYKAPKNEPKDPYARWFCAVKSPMTYGSWEYGDTYRAEVLKHAALVEAEENWKEEMAA